MRNNNFKKFTFEFLSIFIAVIAAFGLSNWNDNRRDSVAESKILTEILNGLKKDMDDVKLNESGHELGIKAGEFWGNIFTNTRTNLDTLTQHYFIFTRDFVSIQNTSGYETLKSKGLELIKNDSLRSQIISLYEYDYKTLMKLEEQYYENQFQQNYFQEINRHIAPNFRFDVNGNIIGIDLPISLSKAERNILLSYLWKMKINRNFVLKYYKEVKEKINKLSNSIEMELKK